MYIPTFAILALIVAYVFFYMKQEDEKSRKHAQEQEEKRKEQQERCEEYTRNLAARAKREKELMCDNIAMLLDCPKKEAENIYDMLNDTCKYTDFEYAETRYEKLKVIESAKKEQIRRISIVEYIKNNIMPIIFDKKLSLTEEEVTNFAYDYYDFFENFNDIDLVEKVIQINFAFHSDGNNYASVAFYNSNINKLMELVPHSENIYLDTVIPPYEFIDSLSLEIYEQIIKKLNIKIHPDANIPHSIYKEIYELSSGEISDILPHIFALCVLTSQNIYDCLTKEYHKKMGKFDYLFYFPQVFNYYFFKPVHYDLCDYEKIFFKYKNEIIAKLKEMEREDCELIITN